MEGRIPRYAGFAAGEEKDAALIPGWVCLDGYDVVFQAETGEVRFPQSRVQMELAADRSVWFSDPDQPAWQFGTADLTVLKDRGFGRDYRTSRQLREIQARLEGGRTLRYALRFLAVFAGLAALLWMLGGVAVRIVVRLTPVAWEVEIGEDAYRELQPRLRPHEDPKDRALLTAISERLLAGRPDRQQAIQVTSVVDPVPNAFALPGGRILVTTGLLNAVEEPEQLAGVLAHEMAHVTHRHALRQVITTLGPYYVLRLFVSDRQGFLSAVSAGSLLLVHQDYSRGFEREADRTAWRLLVRADIDPRGLVSLLRKLSPLTERWQMEGALGRALRSHPPTPERIAALDALWAASDRKDGFRPLAAPGTPDPPKPLP